MRAHGEEAMLPELDVKITISLITAISSMLIAIYTNVRSRGTSQELARLTADLDRHRETTLLYMKAYLALEIEERNRALNAFAEYLKHIQIFREKVRRVMGHPDSYSTHVLAEEIAEIREGILNSYATNQMYLNGDDLEDDRTLAHSLKNESCELGEILPVYVETRDMGVFQEIERRHNAVETMQARLRNCAIRCANSVVDDIERRVGERVAVSGGTSER